MVGLNEYWPEIYEIWVVTEPFKKFLKIIYGWLTLGKSHHASAFLLQNEKITLISSSLPVHDKTYSLGHT